MGNATTFGTDVPGFEVLRWEFSATSGPSGESPGGRVRAETGVNGAQFFDGPVVCLSVQRNVALVVVDTPEFLIPISLRVTDNATTLALASRTWWNRPSPP
jgi:hypothetical protein